jgi:hypothetical protein
MHVQVKQRARIFCKKFVSLGRICIAGETPHNPARPECLHSVGYSVPLTNTFDKLPRLLERSGHIVGRRRSDYRRTARLL